MNQVNSSHLSTAICGVHRWLYRVWALVHTHIEACSDLSSSSPINLSDSCKQLVEPVTQKAVKQVCFSDMIARVFLLQHRIVSCDRQVTIDLEERLVFNVAVSEMMILSNTLKVCVEGGRERERERERERDVLKSCMYLPDSFHVCTGYLLFHVTIREAAVSGIT